MAISCLINLPQFPFDYFHVSIIPRRVVCYNYYHLIIPFDHLSHEEAEPGDEEIFRGQFRISYQLEWNVFI